MQIQVKRLYLVSIQFITVSHICTNLILHINLISDIKAPIDQPIDTHFISPNSSALSSSSNKFYIALSYISYIFKQRNALKQLTRGGKWYFFTSSCYFSLKMDLYYQLTFFFLQVYGCLHVLHDVYSPVYLISTVFQREVFHTQPLCKL